MTWVPPRDLLDLDLSGLLKLITAGKLAGEALKWAKKRVRELWEKKEYGFTPDPELATSLQKISQTEAYSRMRQCIGNHRFLPVVRLSLRIEELSEEGKVDLISKIKDSVHKKYGFEGVRILNMGATGILKGIIQYLSDLKIRNNYTQNDVASIFEKILKKWTKISIFHKAEYGEIKLEKTIIKYMDAIIELFFVFAAGTAGNQAKKVIARLNNNSEIRRRGYMFDLYSRREDLTGRSLFTWVFEYLGVTEKY